MTTVLLIGDSVSKDGIRLFLRMRLRTLRDDVISIQDNTNNSDIQDWIDNPSWFAGTYEILRCNTGLHDLLTSDADFLTKAQTFWAWYHTNYPTVKVIWASTTHRDSIYVANNATIDSHDTIMESVLNSEYGIGNWEKDDMQLYVDLNINEMGGRTDGTHYYPYGYTLQAKRAYSKIIEIVDSDFSDGIVAGGNVAFGVCPGGPADFKSGTPSLNINDGIATFSVPQTHDLIGVGAEVSYNDGTSRKAYFAPLGKTTTSIWSVTTALGGNPPNCTGATVTAITHPFNSIAAAETAVTGASYLNNTVLTSAGANVNLHIPCYKEQTSYTKDAAHAYWDMLTGDRLHRLYIYSPIDTNTECNKSMGVTSPKYDSTKYEFNNFRIQFKTFPSWAVVRNIQFTTTNLNGNLEMLDFVPVSGEKNEVYQCLFGFIPYDVTRGRYAMNNNGTGNGTVLFHNNLIFTVGAALAVLGAVHCNVGSDVVHLVYNNTIVGNWQYAIYPTSGYETVFIYNNIIKNVTTKTIFSTNTSTHDYNVLEITESEDNETLTIQSVADLFEDTSDASEFNWDFSLKNGSDALSAGINLYLLFGGYSGDIEQGPPCRIYSTWDCGCDEKDVSASTFGTLSCTPSSGVEGDTVTITNTNEAFYGVMIIKDTDASGISFDEITVVNSNQLTAKIPAGFIGPDIYVENTNIPDYGIISDAFTIISQSIINSNIHVSIALLI